MDPSMYWSGMRYGEWDFSANSIFLQISMSDLCIGTVQCSGVAVQYGVEGR